MMLKIKVMSNIILEKATVHYDPKNYAMAIIDDLQDSIIPGFEEFELFLN